MAGKNKPRLHFIQYFNPFYVVQVQQKKKTTNNTGVIYLYLIALTIIFSEFPSSSIAQFSSPIVNSFNNNYNNFWNRPPHRNNNNNNHHNNNSGTKVQKFGQGESAVRFGVNDEDDDSYTNRNRNNNYFPSVNQFSRSQNNPFARPFNNNQFVPVIHSSAEFFPTRQREIRTSANNNNNNPLSFSRNNQQPTLFNSNGRGRNGAIVQFPGDNGQQNQPPVQFQQNNNQRQPATSGISFGQQTNDNNGRAVGTSSSSSGSCVTIDGQTGTCHQFSSCAIYMPEFVLTSKSKGNGNTCRLNDGSTGMCCRDLKQNPAETPNSPVTSIRETEAFIFTRLGGMNGVLGSVNENSVEDSIRKSKIYFDDYDRIEKGLLERDLAIKRGTSSHGHLQFFRTSKRAIDLSRLGQNLLQSTKELSSSVSSRLGGGGSNAENSIEDIGVGFKNLNVAKSTIGQQCPARVKCDIRSGAINYRSIDGSCNNLREPSLGTSFSTLIRLISPQYSDGIWAPRIASDGSQLPSARLLSSVFNQDIDAPNSDFSLWLMQFGQFLDHDISHVPIVRYSNGSGIECCTSDGDFLPVTLTHPQCLPIEIPSNDYFFRPFRQHCMNFVRSMVGPRRDCSLGYGDQLNQITAFLDNSNVYGSSVEDHRELRAFQGGKLKTEQFQSMTNGNFNQNRRPNRNQNQNLNFNPSSTTNGRKGMLPIQTKHLGDDECTNDATNNTFCFNAGDLRVNEMIGLTVTHLVWFREHNRIADKLQGLNPHWNDGRLFEESRKILNAQYQHIIYNEWLPIIVGRSYMEVYGILPQSQGYFKGYDDNIDPGVSNAFAAAAFRMGHTLIQGLLSLINQAGQIEREDELVIHEHFNKPFRLREVRMVDKLLRTITNTPIQSFDRFITSEVTNRLFQEDNKPFGMDLISLNIQRGREHGLPGYNQYRQLCKLPKANRFEDFGDWIDSTDIIGKLKKYYNNVNDVDLFIGGILEKPLAGAILGPTFTCIVGDQFARARKSDRFVYDGGNFPHSFTPGQLNEIRKASFARILCDNSDDLQSIQPYAFMMPKQSLNPLLDCKGSSLPRIDLELWKEF